jgi:uncharacterized membrane protein required for colicin V production
VSEHAPGSSGSTDGAAPDRGNPWAAPGGFLLGVVTTWLVAALVGILGYVSQGDHATTTTDYVVIGLALLVVPVAALVVVVSARVRTWYLIGFAVGSIVGSGVCTSLSLAG